MKLANLYDSIKDSRPLQEGDYITIHLHRDAKKSPDIWVEKYSNGPDKALYIAFTWGASGSVASLARSEKFTAFIDQLKSKLDILDENFRTGDSNVSVLSSVTY